MKLLDYTVAHDSGNIINPLIVDGQVQGGVAHGIGNALFEWMKYDAGAQPLTTSFQDYLLPAAPDVPGCRIEHVETPNPRERASPSLSTGNEERPFIFRTDRVDHESKLAASSRGGWSFGSGLSSRAIATNSQLRQANDLNPDRSSQSRISPPHFLHVIACPVGAARPFRT